MDIRRMTLAAVCAVIVMALAYMIFTPPLKAAKIIAGQTMGTSYNIQIAGCPQSFCTSLDQEISQRLKELNSILSHYDRESALSNFNRHQEDSWFTVPADLYNVVAYAQMISKRTDGKFDITVAPAVNAWGFGPDPAAGIPDRSILATASGRIGFEQLSLRANPPALKKNNPDLSLDLSALAKGYAVDQLALLIESYGLDNYLIEIGGEIRASGIRSDGRHWRIGLEPPDTNMMIEYIISVPNTAVATSGDYRNFFIAEDKRYSHTIDPVTASPVVHNLAGVSVVLPATVQADAMATLLMVLGPEEGPLYAQLNEIPALFFIRTEKGIATFYSTALEPYLMQTD